MTERLIIGCGYLGRRVAAAWRAHGHRVLVTTRSHDRAEELRRQGLEPLICDIHDPESLHQLPAVGTVLHCVGFDRTSGHTYRDVYVTGLSNVLEALPPPERFLYVSSGGVYGQRQGEEVDETSVTEPSADSGRIILEAERLLQSRMPMAIRLRFSGIYGPGRLIGAADLRAGNPLSGDPEKWLNLIHVEDGVTSVLAAEEHGRAGEAYNVSDDRPVRRRDYYGLLAQLLGVPVPGFQGGTTTDAADRRIVNRRLRNELGVTLRYPSVWEGLPASLRV